MLEDIRNSYLKSANNIPDWQTENKNILLNNYIKYENDPIKKNWYFSAIICRYWGNIGKYYNQSKASFTIEDCYSWLCDAILYALRKRKWLEPGNKMYDDPAGPDKIVNRCIFSTRHIHYQLSNMDKRKINYNSSSLEEMQEDMGNAYATALPAYFCDSTAETYNDSQFVDLIKKEVTKGELFEAIILDGICFQDSFKWNSKDNIYEFSLRQLIKHLNNPGEDFLNYFSYRYDAPYNELNQVCLELGKVSNTIIYNKVRKTLYKMRTIKELEDILCLHTS